MKLLGPEMAILLMSTVFTKISSTSLRALTDFSWGVHKVNQQAAGLNPGFITKDSIRRAKIHIAEVVKLRPTGIFCVKWNFCKEKKQS